MKPDGLIVSGHDKLGNDARDEADDGDLFPTDYMAAVVQRVADHRE